MDLKSRIEITHILDQLSDDQYSTLISKVLSTNRASTNQILTAYFAANNNTDFGNLIKDTAKSILRNDPSVQSNDSNHSNDDSEETSPADQSKLSIEEVLSPDSAVLKVLDDAMMFTHLVQFLPDKQISRMEVLNRRSFLSLRQYPVLTKLESGDWIRNRHLIRIGAIHPECSTPQDLVNELDVCYGLQIQCLTPLEMDPTLPPYWCCERVELPNVLQKHRMLELCRKAQLECRGSLISVTEIKQDVNKGPQPEKNKVDVKKEPAGDNSDKPDKAQSPKSTSSTSSTSKRCEQTTNIHKISANTTTTTSSSKSSNPNRVRGVFKRGLNGKPFGFIDADGIKGDLFVYCQDVQGNGDLRPGDVVEFVVGTDYKDRAAAFNVSKVTSRRKNRSRRKSRRGS